MFLLMLLIPVICFLVLIKFPSRTPAYLRNRIDYSKDYMNNPVVRNMDNRDRNL